MLKPCRNLGLWLLRQTRFPVPFCGFSCDHTKDGEMDGGKHGLADKTPTFAPFYHRLVWLTLCHSVSLDGVGITDHPSVTCSSDLQGCLCSQLPVWTPSGDFLGHLLGPFIPHWLERQPGWPISITGKLRHGAKGPPMVDHYSFKHVSPLYCSKGCPGQCWILLFCAGVVWVVTNTVRPATAQALAITCLDSLGHHPHGQQRTWSTYPGLSAPA